MKVAFLVHTFPSLSQTFILDQMTGLMDRGHELDVYAVETGSSSPVHPDVSRYNLEARTRYGRAPEGRLERLLGFVHRAPRYLGGSTSGLLESLNPFRFGRRALSLRLFFEAEPFLDRGGYDVIHAHFGPNGLRAARLKRMGVLEAPLVTTFYGFDVSRHVRRYGEDVYDPLFREARLVLALSETMKERLVELGCPNDRLMIHPLGVDPEVFSPPPEENRRQDEKVDVLTVSRLVEKKGLFDALEAFRILRESHPQVRYRIAGEGPLKDELASWIDERNLGDEVELLGALGRQEVIDLYRASDVMLLPSKTAESGDEEGTPTALLESQASGLPVVATRHAGIPEIVRDGETGHLVEEGDVTGLVKALQALTEDPSGRRAMGEAARSFMLDHHDIHKLNDRLLDLYRGVQSDTSEGGIP